MVSKEQIAHDLTMVYLCNLYGVDVSGRIFSGDGDVSTEHLPSIDEPQYTKIKTGEKGLFGIEKKQKVQEGYKVDILFSEMVEVYLQAYERFYQILNNNDNLYNNR